MSTVTTEKREALNDDAPQECDQAPLIPTNIIFDSILPFLQDRRTWNSVCTASKESHDAGMERTPPWPETKFYLTGQDQEEDVTTSLKFSPCGSFLAFGVSTSSFRLAILDRRGRITRLVGHTSSIRHLSFSKDGKYLASAGLDNSIRIWPTNPTTGLPQQSDKTLRHRGATTCLDFAPDNSNILVCGDYFDIKVWNVETEVCTHHFEHHGWPHWYIRSMHLPPAGNKVRMCRFVTSNGSLIRTRWDPQSDGITSDIVNMSGLRQVEKSAFSHCGSFLAASSHENSRTGDNPVHLTLFDMKTMKVVQTIALDNCTHGALSQFRIFIRWQNAGL